MQYVKLVEFLLLNLKWPSDYLKHAIKEAGDNMFLEKLLKSKLSEVRMKKNNDSNCFKCFQ
jgi:hypothetical protein